MSGSHSRRRGKTGEREARHVLAEHGYDLIDTSDGISVCDLIAEKRGHRYAVEVKMTRQFDFERSWRQAKEQAKALKALPMLMWRIPNRPHTFLCCTDFHETVLRGNGRKEAR